MAYIKAVVKTKQKEESITEKKPGYFNISVKDKAERNMANSRVIELIAQYFKVPTGKVKIINGHHHPHKLLVVDN